MPLRDGVPIYNKPDAERACGKLVALYKAALAYPEPASADAAFRAVLQVDVLLITLGRKT
jgi:hypothetical protein